MHEGIAAKVQQGFHGLYEARFPVEKVVPVDSRDVGLTGEVWDDETAMGRNKTSGYCPRFIPDTDRLSEHAKGLAVDINPWINPCIHADGTVEPHGAVYNPNVDGAISLGTAAGRAAIEVFDDLGFEWGGNWPVPAEDLPPKYRRHSAQPHLPDAPADYQHFQLDDDHRAQAFDLPDFS